MKSVATARGDVNSQPALRWAGRGTLFGCSTADPQLPDRKQSHFGARHLFTNMLYYFVYPQMQIRTSWTLLRSSDARTLRACKGLNPVESALPKNTPVTPVQSALPHSL